MSEPRIGAIAPDFDLPTDGGGRVRLSELRGRKVVLYFYPADDTEACTTEAVDFSGRQPEFESAGATIVGVSPDSPRSHDRFKTKHDIGVLLASDSDLEVVRGYNLWVEKSMFGRKFMGVERATFLIDGEGYVRQIWHKVRVKGHVEEVLAATRVL